MDNGWGVVAGIGAGTGRVGQHRGAQNIVWIGVGPADAFVDQIVQ